MRGRCGKDIDGVIDASGTGDQSANHNILDICHTNQVSVIPNPAEITNDQLGTFERFLSVVARFQIARCVSPGHE